jgi:hypothetical protein
LADGGELGVEGGVERHDEVRAAAAEGGEVEARQVATEVEHHLVVGERRVLNSVEGVKPQPRPVVGRQISATPPPTFPSAAAARRGIASTAPSRLPLAHRVAATQTASSATREGRETPRAGPSAADAAVPRTA